MTRRPRCCFARHAGVSDGAPQTLATDDHEALAARVASRLLRRATANVCAGLRRAAGARRTGVSRLRPFRGLRQFRVVAVCVGKPSQLAVLPPQVVRGRLVKLKATGSPFGVEGDQGDRGVGA